MATLPATPACRGTPAYPFQVLYSLHLFHLPLVLAVTCILSGSALHCSWSITFKPTLHSWLPVCLCFVRRLALCNAMHALLSSFLSCLCPYPCSFCLMAPSLARPLLASTRARALSWACAMRIIITTTCSAHKPIAFNPDRRTDAHMEAMIASNKVDTLCVLAVNVRVFARLWWKTRVVPHEASC